MKNKNNKSTNKTALSVRIMCGILALLTILGGVALIIAYLV